MQNLTFNSVIEQIKERHGLKSDYAVCKAFDLSPQNVSGWRKERSYPDEKMCGILAEAAGIDPLVLAASMQAQRSKTEEARSLWAMVAERLQMVPQALAAAFFAVLFATSFVAGDAHATSASGMITHQNDAVTKLYIVSSRQALKIGALELQFSTLSVDPWDYVFTSSS
ncbi:hypothetical protein [Comamonas thiooxydans]|uniref:hypothetical protein n=1 Tax=Comamonas thiooxydans TaxID=363952 RepID=UPI00050F2F46|nr:hypothetical protein [Comamonas thiooxydans]KGH20772.1 hypothetical protein P606_19530 [Comamonas thiooxydans]